MPAWTRSSAAASTAARFIMLALCLVSQPALLLPTVPRAQPLPTCTRREPPPVLGLFDEFPLSRRETLLLLPLTLVGIGGIRYATTDAFPSSIEGPITKAPTVDMRGKVAVVTGANTGIGYETALRLAQEGATVVLAGRSLAKLTDAAGRIRAQLPFSTVEVEVLDLASLESVRKFAAAFLARHGTLDALINNAGVSAIPERRETADGIEQILQVNFLGHFLLTSLLMPALRAAAAPRVINVSSRASFLPNAKLTQGETPQLDLQHAGAAYGACQTPVDCPAYSASKIAQVRQPSAQPVPTLSPTLTSLHPTITSPHPDLHPTTSITIACRLSCTAHLHARAAAPSWRRVLARPRALRPPWPRRHRAAALLHRGRARRHARRAGGRGGGGAARAQLLGGKDARAGGADNTLRSHLADAYAAHRRWPLLARVRRRREGGRELERARGPRLPR